MAGKHWTERVEERFSGKPKGRSKPAYSGNQFYLAEAEQADWKVLKSSNVSGVAFVEDFGRLYIEFKPHGGRPASLYVYHSVPRGVYEGLLSAPSAGQYVFYVIRAKGTDSVYGYEQLY